MLQAIVFQSALVDACTFRLRIRAYNRDRAGCGRTDVPVVPVVKANASR